MARPVNDWEFPYLLYEYWPIEQSSRPLERMEGTDVIVATQLTNILAQQRILLHKRKREEEEQVALTMVNMLPMHESVQPPRKMTCRDKSNTSRGTIRSLELYTTSGLDSTLRGRGLEPFWNSQCKEISSNLWLPIGTGSQDLRSISLNGSSIGTVGGLSLQIRTRDDTVPKLNSPKTLSQLSPSSLAESKENEDMEENATVLRNMKVRIKPTRKQREWLIKTQHNLRALRNATIDQVKKNKIEISELRSKMVSVKGRKGQEPRKNVAASQTFDDPEKQVKHDKKWEAIDSTPATIRKNAMRKLQDEYFQNIKDVKEGRKKKFKMNFSSRKKNKGRVNIPIESQAFSNKKPFDDTYIYAFARTDIDDKCEDCSRGEMCKKAKKGKECSTKFHKLRYKMDGSKKRRKKLPDPRNHDCKIIYQHPNRWYMLIPYDKPVVHTKAPYKDVSLDPGTRCFQNIYSHDAGIAGGIDLQDRKQSLIKLRDKIKQAQSRRDKASTRNRSKFWGNRYVELWLKMKNKTRDLHAKTIRFLVDNFQEIRVGDFGSSFVKKNKKMGKIVKQDCCFLAHYSFRQKLLEHAATRTIVEVSESYTSKTCCRCGTIYHELGSKKTFSCANCSLVIDRDTNGAINMYIKEKSGQGIVT